MLPSVTEDVHLFPKLADGSISGRTRKALLTVPVSLGDGGLRPEVGGPRLSALCTVSISLTLFIFF